MRSVGSDVAEGNKRPIVQIFPTMHWVYILKCSDGSCYTGSTSNLELRLAEHDSGICDGYTAKRLPVELVFSQETSTQDEAFRVEHQIKGWSRRKKEAIIEGRWDLLPELAASSLRRPHSPHPSTLRQAQDAPGASNARAMSEDS